MPLQKFVIVTGLLLVPNSVFGQQPPPRDPRALAVLQQSLTAMGGLAPADSVAAGNITIVAGSETQTGTIQIVTRGVDQTAESIRTASGSRGIIFSRGLTIEIEDNTANSLPLELAVTSQCASFPLPLLASTLSNAGNAFAYLGLEEFEGAPAHHTQVWSTFARHPRLRHLAEFSRKDIWIDAASGLVRKIGYDRRAGGGSEPKIRVEVYLSEYRSVGGVLYPFRIEKSLNGTPWATITIQNVAFNTGLTDANFPVE